MKRVVSFVVAVVAAVGLGILAQATPAAASVSGGGCTPSSQRSGPNGWKVSACISYNTTFQRPEWDGYIDIHGSHCNALNLVLFLNNEVLHRYLPGGSNKASCSITGHIPLQVAPASQVKGSYQSVVVITWDNGTVPYQWKSPVVTLR